MTSRERVIANLEGKPADRAAVVCPGGMMSMAVTEVMRETGLSWPEAHADGRVMAGLALAMQEATGFDNLAAPFCMTVEAEAYGATVDLGDETRHPRVRGFVVKSAEEELPRPNFGAGRARTLIEVIKELRRLRPEAAIMGNVVGSFSLLGSLWDPLMALRSSRRDPETVRRRMEEITDNLTEFARMQIAAGADVVCVAEPTATGEIIGGELFGKLVAPSVKRIVRGVHEAGGAAVVHICGNAQTILGELAGIEAEAMSFDSMVDIVKLGRSGVPWQVMGNVDAFLLANGKPSQIRRRTEELIRGGVRLAAPACGIVTTTPVSNLRAMSEAAER